MNDSVGQKITALDFDLESGALSNQRTLVDFKGTTSEPDGMVIECVKNFPPWVSITDRLIWIVTTATYGLLYMDPIISCNSAPRASS